MPNTQILPQKNQQNTFSTDTLHWFKGLKHGHMGKWQYLEPKSPNDPCRGQELWDKWENASEAENMLNRQKNVMELHAQEIVSMADLRSNIVDLGPGGLQAVTGNTLPIIKAYADRETSYTAIDLNHDYANDACNLVKQEAHNTKTQPVISDFTKPIYNMNAKDDFLVLFNGGTIGNFEAKPNTPYAIELMAQRIRELKQNYTKGTYMLIGLETTQDPEILYNDYDHPAHAAYEINLMYGIKRDLIPHEEDFNPSAWKYKMKWWPESYQFCHIAEATERQEFTFMGQCFVFEEGEQLVVDNSFKFPVLAMQRSAQLAKTRYVRAFSDKDNRMVSHLIEVL